ncbi:phosphoribosyltransferase family protein [Brevibacillus sp. NPDC058079]|uniref:phosphoribosyltransferase family protein n=1 Tax=Brevibacillus sp. NPDC058079 TaxID=3346330 RepID=UPI0036E7C195
MTATLTSFNILDELKLNVKVDVNPFGLELSDLFDMGARVNPKRSFLFISKLIGKHLDVQPDVPKATGYLLANLLVKHLSGAYFSSNMDQLIHLVKTGQFTQQLKNELSYRYLLPESTLFIGFAETATGLGHAVYSAFDNAFFVHTTREEIVSATSIFDFEEEHSHAVDHRCYLFDERWIKDAEQIVLIDDEMTTGKTTLNLIRSLNAVYPKKKYVVLSLLDWRTKVQEQAYAQVETELGVEITTLSLIRGEIDLAKEAFFSYEGEPVQMEVVSYRMIDEPLSQKITHEHINQGTVEYLADTGRFGIPSLLSDFLEEDCKQVGNKLKEKRMGGRTLVMGVGEFMYLPSRIASYMGDGVTHKSTTRSPIYPNSMISYPIHDRIAYKDDDGTQYYMYNMSGKYDEVFLLFEREPSDRLKQELASLLHQKGIEHISLVVL